jgi:hypothetical protein
VAEREVGWSYSCSGEDGNFRDYFPEPRLRKSNLTNEGNLFHLIAFLKITFLTRNVSNSAPYEEFYFYPRSLLGRQVRAFAFLGERYAFEVLGLQLPAKGPPHDGWLQRLNGLV